MFSVLLLHRLACRGFAGFCTLCQGAPIGIVTALGVAVWWCLLAPRASGASLVISSCGSRPLWGLCCSLLAFLYLRVGALLACGVCGASSLRSCGLGCPSWLVLLLMSLFVLHLLLRWGGLVTGLWPLLLLLCVGLLWSLCYAVLPPWALERPPLQGLSWLVPLV